MLTHQKDYLERQHRSDRLGWSLKLGQINAVSTPPRLLKSWIMKAFIVSNVFYRVPTSVPHILALFVVSLALSATALRANEFTQQDAAADVFQQRIMPIFCSSKPSSCVQCHLASVDLKDYILPSHTETFTALLNAGLIDRNNPTKSKILSLIQMGEKDPNLTAERLHAKTRQAEYEAFEYWIIKSCEENPDAKDATRPGDTDNSLLSDNQVGPRHPIEVVRHTRKDRLIESFTREVWSQRMRCFPCHTPFEINPENPQHQKAKQRHQELVREYGARMNLFEKSPTATMDRWISSSRKVRANQLPLLHLESPGDSLILLKPLSKIPTKLDDGTLPAPSSVIPVSHAGGLKMFEHDQSYKSIRRWIEDYADVVQGNYKFVDQLPTDRWIPTEKIIRISEIPQRIPTGTPVQIFVHLDDQPNDPIAFTQGIVTPRHFVNGPLHKIGQPSPTHPLKSSNAYNKTDNEPRDGESNLNPGEENEPTLPPGTYVIRVYVDTKNKLAKTPERFLESEDFYGATHISTEWKTGFPNATIISATSLHATAP